MRTTCGVNSKSAPALPFTHSFRHYVFKNDLDVKKQFIVHSCEIQNTFSKFVLPKDDYINI